MPLASHWPELSRLLDEALELPEAERAAWIDRLPPERAALAPTLRRLLLHPDGALPPDWLQSPPPLATSREAEFVPDQRIGPWRLIQELGQGGMGVVWRARRDDGELGRDAALKLPHAHLLAGDLRGRFARERDILASLSHPNIATLYDARLAEGGQPWLALELVEGRNIVDACRERQLDVPARLRWFDQVLDAIRYAHSRLVVHRDLKPSNVLVDATGRVKLLDFGIAKLLSADGKDADALTRAGTLAVTPAYAAPEQLAGGEVTTATDVYALGVLLFELLSGRRPFDGPRTSGREAPRASDCADDPATRRALRGDLDAILARALALRPDDRYPTADALHADLARARRDEPVEARHIGALQLAGKFLRRHRTAAAFSGLLIAVVAAGVAGVFWQAREARQQARRAEAVTAFLTSVFAASDPRIASDTPRGQITARQLLDLGVPRIEAGFADDPRTQIELLRAVADIYRALDEHERADALQERQLALVRRLYGPHHPNVLDHAVELGSRACGAADAAICAIAQRDADALLRAAGDRDAARRGTWWINEGLRLQTDGKQIAAARTAFGNAVATFVDGAPETRGHVTSLLELSSFLQSQQEHSAALDVGRRAVEVAERLPTRDDAELQTLWGNLGIIHQQLGRFTEAADAFRRSADIADRTTGADSRAALLPRANAARTLHLAGERIAAHVEYARVVPLLAALGDQDRDGVFGRAIYCERLTAEGRPLEAIPGLEAAERSLRERAAYDFQLRLVRRFLGEAYLAAGNLSAARRMLETSLADYVANDAPESAPVLAARDAMGLLLLAEGRPLEAREQFSAVVAAERTGTLVQATLAHGGLAQVALALRDPDTALSESAQALASWSRVEGFRDVRTEPRLQRIRADALAARGDRREAQRLEDAAAAASAKYDDPRAPTVQRRSFARR